MEGMKNIMVYGVLMNMGAFFCYRGFNTWA
jgi:hypothetical protein